MTRLLLIAHAATAWNAERRYQGWTDVPLSEVGREQARRLAAGLAEVPIETVSSSDLSRAVETAEMLATPRGFSVRTIRHLREMNFGLWEGKTADEIGDPSAAWLRGDIDARPPGGESFEEFAQRVSDFILANLFHLPKGKIAIVGHRGWLRVFVARLLGLPATSHWSFRIDIASITEFDFSSGRPVLTRLNDTHHVDDREERHG